MRLLRIVPDDTKFDFMRFRRISFPVSAVLSILAIVFGHQAKREIAERPGLGGAGLATAGIVLGWIGVALVVLAVLFIVLVVAASTSTSPG